MDEKYKECLSNILNKISYRNMPEKEVIAFLDNVRIIGEALKLYSKYEKLINLMEVGNFDIDSVCNLIYIQAETIDLNDYATIENINELYKEGKIKGYDK